MRQLTIVIVSYNVRDYLAQCLMSLKDALENVDAEILIVDNNSKDDTVEYIRQYFPDVEMIENLQNLGFARANNIAIRKTDSKYVLLLNPDTIVGKDTIKDCMTFMDSHADAGATGVRMLHADGSDAKESRRGIPRPLSAFYKMIGLCDKYPNNRHFAHYYMSYLPWDSPQQIEIISGAYCMLRREALNKVGLLDEDFFMYGEDIDLSYRILKGGYKNYYLPSIILHYKGESTVKTSFRYVHVFYEAMLIFFRKHFHNLIFLLSIPIKTAIYLKAFLALISLLTNYTKKNLGFLHPTPSKEVDYLVLNIENKKFDEILNTIKSSDHSKPLAIYHPQFQQVITADGVFKRINDINDFIKK